MKFFLFFLLTCFFAGMAMPKVRITHMGWLLAGFSILIMLGYFFLRFI